MNVRKGSGMFATIGIKKIEHSPLSTPSFQPLSTQFHTLPQSFLLCEYKTMLASTVTILSEAEATNRCFKQIIMGQMDYDERG